MTDAQKPNDIVYNFDNFTDRARRVMALAGASATQAGYSYVGSEHLLMGMVREEAGVASTVLRSHGVTPDVLGKLIVDAKGGADASTNVNAKDHASNELKAIVQAAREEVSRLNHHYLGTEHLLLGMLKLKLAGKWGGRGYEFLGQFPQATIENLRSAIDELLGLAEELEGSPAALKAALEDVVTAYLDRRPVTPHDTSRVLKHLTHGLKPGEFLAVTVGENDAIDVKKPAATADALAALSIMPDLIVAGGQLQADLKYQIAAKHDPKTAAEYPSVVEWDKTCERLVYAPNPAPEPKEAPVADNTQRQNSAENFAKQADLADTMQALIDQGPLITLANTLQPGQQATVTRLHDEVMIRLGPAKPQQHDGVNPVEDQDVAKQLADVNAALKEVGAPKWLSDTAKVPLTPAGRIRSMEMPQNTKAERQLTDIVNVLNERGAPVLVREAASHPLTPAGRVRTVLNQRDRFKAFCDRLVESLEAYSKTNDLTGQAGNRLINEVMTLTMKLKSDKDAPIAVMPRPRFELHDSEGRVWQLDLANPEVNAPSKYVVDRYDLVIDHTNKKILKSRNGLAGADAYASMFPGQLMFKEEIAVDPVTNDKKVRNIVYLESVKAAKIVGLDEWGQNAIGRLASGLAGGTPLQASAVCRLVSYVLNPSEGKADDWKAKQEPQGRITKAINLLVSPLAVELLGECRDKAVQRSEYNTASGFRDLRDVVQQVVDTLELPKVEIPPAEPMTKVDYSRPIEIYDNKDSDPDVVEIIYRAQAEDYNSAQPEKGWAAVSSDAFRGRYDATTRNDRPVLPFDAYGVCLLPLVPYRVKNVTFKPKTQETGRTVSSGAVEDACVTQSGPIAVTTHADQLFFHINPPVPSKWSTPETVAAYSKAMVVKELTQNLKPGEVIVLEPKDEGVDVRTVASPLVLVVPKQLTEEQKAQFKQAISGALGTKTAEA